MEQLISLHKQASTTPKIRAAIQASTDPAWMVAERYGISEQTVWKWRNRNDVHDRSHTPHRFQTTLTSAQEAVAVALRRSLLLPLDDLLAVVVSGGAAAYGSPPVGPSAILAPRIDRRETRRTMRRLIMAVSAATLTLACLPCMLSAEPSRPASSDGAGERPDKDEQMTASDSEQELRRRVSLAGDPESVLWAAKRLGPENPGSFPPGPGDHVLHAILRYRSAQEVTALLGEGPTEPAEIGAPAWFPEELHPNGWLPVIRHYRVEGFMDATVMTVPDVPEVIILERHSS